MISGLTENEWVFTNNGMTVISDLVLMENPQILTYNFETKQTEYKKVIKITKSEERHKLKRIIMSYVVQKSKVMFTDNYHFFRLTSDNQIEPAAFDTLKQGDLLLSLKTENEIFFPDMWSIANTMKYYLYDFEIEDNAPFFAGQVVPLLMQKTI